MNFLNDMKKISDEMDYQRERDSLAAMLKPGKQLPHMVFSEEFTSFCFIDFYLGLNSEFIESMKALGGESGVVLYFIDPDPMDHYKLSGEYSILSFSAHDTLQAIISQLNKPIAGKSGEALRVNNYKFAYYSRDKDWVVYCDRDFEFCVIGSKREDRLKEVCAAISLAHDGAEVCYSFDDYFMEQGTEFDKSLILTLSKNYKNSGKQ